MKTIIISATLWFIILTSVLLTLFTINLHINKILIIYLITNSILSFFYWLITNKLKEKKRPPLSHRAFVFILLLIFGPLGYIIFLFTLFYAKKDGVDLYKKYKDYIQVKWEQHDTESTNYSKSVKMHLDKEPIIDTLKYGDLDGKRGAAELLARMGDSHAITTLKTLASENDPSIRFVATSKLESIETEYMEDMEYYSQIIKVCGNEPEILLQYGYLLLEFTESGLVDNDMIYIYINKSYKIFSILLDSKEYVEYAKIGMTISLRLLRRYKDAIDIIEFIDDDFKEDKVNELAECYFQLREFGKLKELIKIYSGDKELKESKFQDWVESITELKEKKQC